MQRKQPINPSQQGYKTPYLGAWRRCAQLSMAALASRAGVTVRTVLLAEHQQRMPVAATVDRLAAAIGVPPSILLSYPPTAEEAREDALAVLTLAASRNAPIETPDIDLLAPVGASA